MTQIFEPGQKVYLLYWRRREEDSFTRMQIFTTKRRRDNANLENIILGLITLTAEWQIPSPFSKDVKGRRLKPTCPKCGAEMNRLHYGPGNDEWVCPNKCGSTLDEVMQQAEKLARDILDRGGEHGRDGGEATGTV